MWKFVIESQTWCQTESLQESLSKIKVKTIRKLWFSLCQRTFSTWKILPAKPKHQRQPMATCYHDHQLPPTLVPKAFHFVPNPDAIDFSRFPKCLMFQFGYTCSGLEGYAPRNDLWRVGTVRYCWRTIFCSPGSHLMERWIPIWCSVSPVENFGMMQIQIYRSKDGFRL